MKKTALTSKEIAILNRKLYKGVDYDRCPMCDTPTPVEGGRCTCPNCGHRWTAGSH